MTGTHNGIFHQMKTVKLSYYAVLRECSGKSGEIRETQAETFADLYNELKNEYNFPLDSGRVRVAIGEHYCGMDEKLTDNAEVVFIPPVAGG